MPHGAGHAGGHHGGGYHGGGYHHHHHHHHHRHYGGYGVYTYGGPYYRYGYRRRSLAWGFFWMTTIGVGAMLAVIFSVRYGLPNDNSSDNYYAPNETRIISYSPTFCDHITVDTSFSLKRSEGTFSVLSQPPVPTDHDSFQFTESVHLDSDINYRHWSFYLYPHSTLNISACKGVSSFSNVEYLLIKGESQYRSWNNHPIPSKAIDHGIVSEVCSSGSTANFSFVVETEDEYYMVFYLSNFSSVTVDVLFDIYRIKYTPLPDSIISNCSFDDLQHTSCDVEIPLGDNIGLLSFSPMSDSWVDNLDINITCGPRIWVYVVISIGTVGFFLLIMVFIVVCCCYWVRKKRSNYQPLHTESTATPVVPAAPSPSTAAYVTGNEAPSPYGSEQQNPAPPKYH